MLGFEVSPIVQYVIAFAIIAALLALFAVVLRRIGGKRFAMTGQERGRGRQPRLGIVDVYDLDRQRQLVLLRRDNVEHLVMLGGPNDLVIESNIVRVPIGRAPVSEMPNERLEQGNEQGRALPEAGIAASAGVPMPSPMPSPMPVPASGANAARAAVNGNAAREPEALRREPAIEQRPHPAQPEPQPQRQQSPVVERQAAPPVAAAPPQMQRSAPPVAVAPPNPAPSPAPLTPAAASPATAPVPTSAPSSPLADLEAVMRAKPRPTEPVAPTPAAEPKRGLFGFGRAAEAPPAAPAFPTRPRATPVAPDFTPQRTAPKFAPAGDEMQAPPAAKSDPASAGVNLGEQSQSAERTAEKPAAQPKPGRPLDDAILADMARQLETALARPKPSQPAAGAPIAEKPAPTPSAPTPSVQPPLAPSVAIDGPSEPKTYKPVSSPVSAPASAPVASVAAAAATVAAVASAFRSASSAAPSSAAPPSPSSPVPPRPYGGEQPARSYSAPIEEQGSESEHDHAKADAGDKPAAASSSAELIAVETLIEAEKPRDDARALWPEADDAADVSFKAAPETSDEPDLDAAPEARPEAVASMTEAASEENVSQESPAEESPAEKSPPQERALEERASEETLSEEAPSEGPAPVEPEPEAADEPQPVAASEEQREEAPPAVIDPFSVDEIEAEFARLLGRSVDKDSKSP